MSPDDQYIDETLNRAMLDGLKAEAIEELRSAIAALSPFVDRHTATHIALAVEHLHGTLETLEAIEGEVT